MRRAIVTGAGVVGALGGAFFALSCAPMPPSRDDCEAWHTCTGDDAAPDGGAEPEGAAPADGATAEGSTLDGASLDGGGGSDVFVCDSTRSPHEEPCVLSGAYGIFVAPPASGGSDTSGDGSKASPFATIGNALTHLGGKGRVYLCTDSAPYAEQVTIASAVSLYGGLSCSGGVWTYVGTRTQVASPSGNYALKVDNVATTVVVEDVTFTSASASGQDSQGSGRSSLAALVNASTVTFRRCAFTAGDGADAVGAGAPSANYAGAAAADGQPPDDAGTGGAGGQASCVDGTHSTGGKGGNGSTNGSTGGDGGAVPMPPTIAGQDGIGGQASRFACSTGADPGANGTAGGPGAAATVYGALAGTGWTPSAGGAGGNGTPGQGGGGGGGKGSPLTGGTGGGAGGCGGTGGPGGPAGGASIALASVSSTVTLDACSLTSGNAGHGGRGADGEPGQGGGNPATPAGFLGCVGALGGNGAGGSGGAGGTAGVSACVVYKGTSPSGAPSCVPGANSMPGAPGSGAAGGMNGLGNGNSGNPGASGLSAPSVQTSLQVQ